MVGMGWGGRPKGLRAASRGFGEVARTASPRSLGCPSPARPSTQPHGTSGATNNPALRPCPLLPPSDTVRMDGGPRTPSWPGRNHSSENEALAEGCFCPDGHVLFNSYTDVCVPTCRKPRQGLGPQPCRGDASWPRPGPPPCRATRCPRPAPTPLPGALPSPLLDTPSSPGVSLPSGKTEALAGVGGGRVRPERIYPCGLWPVPPGHEPLNPQ